MCSRGVSHVSVLTRVLLLLETGYLISQRALNQLPDLPDLPVGLLQPRELPIDSRGQFILSELQRKPLRLQRPLEALVLSSRAQVRDAQGEEVARCLGVLRFHDLLELGDRFVRLRERNQHARKIETGEPESWLMLDRLAIGIGGGGQLALPLEHLSEVVSRLGMQGIQGERLAVGVGRKAQFSCRPSSTPKS